jgi:hypothetical protein
MIRLMSCPTSVQIFVSWNGYNVASVRFAVTDYVRRFCLRYVIRLMSFPLEQQV